MHNLTKTLTAVFAGATLSGAAHAATVNFQNIDAGWQDVVGDDSNVTIDNANPDDIEMRWTDNDGDFSSYEFQTASPVPSGIAVNPPPVTDPILLGTFTHNNQSIDGGTTRWTDVTLKVTIDFLIDAAGPFTRDFFFDFNHNETPNNANPCPDGGGQPCADIITVSNNSLSQNFLVDGVVYTLSVLGFSDQMDGAGSIVSQFVTQEGQENTAFLFATIEAAAVPLPGAVWLMAAGAAGLGFSTRRKKAA